MVDFTRRKFLSLSYEKQHKICAELLCTLYRAWIGEKEWLSSWNLYEQMMQWMKEEISIPSTAKEIADRYHKHLQEAQISLKEHRLLPEIRKKDRQKSEPSWPIYLFLDHIRSAHNVGSILRTVEAFSFGKVYFSSQTPFVTHKQVQSTAMGATNWLECEQGVDLSTLPRPLIVLETSKEAISLYDFIFPSSFTLIVGNEEYGCSEESLRLADYLIEIPLRGHKNSLNVANAFAIAAGEISRQRLSKSFKENL